MESGQTRFLLRAIILKKKNHINKLFHYYLLISSNTNRFKKKGHREKSIIKKRRIQGKITMIDLFQYFYRISVFYFLIKNKELYSLIFFFNIKLQPFEFKI